MIYSMTGFGKSSYFFQEKKVTIEIKSLNSKQLDLSTHIPSFYREKEFEVRNIVSKELLRGKIDVSVFIEQCATQMRGNINIAVAKQYYDELKQMEVSLNLPPQNEYMSILTRMPDVIEVSNTEITEEEGNMLIDCLNDAIGKLKAFRRQEGDNLKLDFDKRVALILSYLDDIAKFEDTRIDSVKSRLLSQLASLQQDMYDKNRFEQELIYYLEKIDFTEEKMRLKNHCSYFMEILNGDESQGKQLTFISQEMGREINTLGSKANNADIQKIVVKMKDELEKIREQLANIL